MIIRSLIGCQKAAATLIGCVFIGAVYTLRLSALPDHEFVMRVAEGHLQKRRADCKGMKITTMKSLLSGWKRFYYVSNDFFSNFFKNDCCMGLCGLFFESLPKMRLQNRETKQIKFLVIIMRLNAKLKPHFGIRLDIMPAKLVAYTTFAQPI